MGAVGVTFERYAATVRSVDVEDPSGPSAVARPRVASSPCVHVVVEEAVHEGHGSSMAEAGGHRFERRCAGRIHGHALLAQDEVVAGGLAVVPAGSEDNPHGAVHVVRDGAHGAVLLGRGVGLPATPELLDGGIESRVPHGLVVDPGLDPRLVRFVRVERFRGRRQRVQFGGHPHEALLESGDLPAERIRVHGPELLPVFLKGCFRCHRTLRIPSTFNMVAEAQSSQLDTPDVSDRQLLLNTGSSMPSAFWRL